MSERKRPRKESPDGHASDEEDNVVVRRSYTYSSQDMVDSFDNALLTVFSELPDDVWEPLDKSKDDKRNVDKKIKVDPTSKAGELFATLPTTCLLEMASYLSTFEVLDMLRTCQRLYERNDEFNSHLIAIVKKSFALLPEQCRKVDRRIEGGWPTLMMFLSEVERKMLIAYRGYPIPPIHQALVGERIMVSLFGRHHFHRCFHVLSPHGCQLRMRQKVRPLFSFCLDDARFKSPYVLLGDARHDKQPFDTTLGYIGVPFMAVDETYRMADTTLCLGIPEAPQRRRGVDIYDTSDPKSAPCVPFTSPFGKNWPSLMASFCMGACREPIHGSAHSPDWKAWSVAWLLERDLIADAQIRNILLTRIPWKDIIRKGLGENEDDETEDDEDVQDSVQSIYPWDSLTIKRDTVQYLEAVLPKQYLSNRT